MKVTLTHNIITAVTYTQGVGMDAIFYIYITVTSLHYDADLMHKFT